MNHLENLFGPEGATVTEDYSDDPFVPASDRRTPAHGFRDRYAGHIERSTAWRSVLISSVCNIGIPAGISVVVFGTGLFYVVHIGLVLFFVWPFLLAFSVHAALSYKSLASRWGDVSVFLIGLHLSTLAATSLFTFAAFGNWML